MAPRLRHVTLCEGCFYLTKGYYYVMSSFTNIHVMDMCKIYCNVHDILVFCDSIFCMVQLKKFKTIKAEHSNFMVQNNRFYAFKKKVRLCNDRS